MSDKGTKRSAGALAPSGRSGSNGPTEASDLSRFAIFDGVSAQHLKGILPLLGSRSTVAGESFGLGRESEPALALVWSGAYRATIISPADVPVTIRHVRSGEHFGEFSIFADVAQTHYSLSVDEEGLLLFLPGEKLRRLVDDVPRMRENLLKHMAREGLVAADRIFEFVATKGKARLQAELLRRCARGVERAGAIVLAPAPTHEALASQVGLTREQISRYLKALSEQGLIRTSRAEIVILNVAELRTLVEQETGRLPSHAPQQA